MAASRVSDKLHRPCHTFDEGECWAITKSQSEHCSTSFGLMPEPTVILPRLQSSRFAHQYAHRLQLQERLTHQIADEIQRVIAYGDVMVVGKGQHRCMSMRGMKTDSMMSNSVVRGRFRELPALRAEALSLRGKY